MNWHHALQPLFQKYGVRHHPLAYKNTCQLIVMAVLSAQATDLMVNNLAPDLFCSHPSLKHFASAKPEDLFPFIKSIRGFRKKADWLVRIAQTLGKESSIPLTIEQLIELPGIGRKSANVIIREAGGFPHGIFLDLHCLRVIRRLGITTETSPEKIEKVLMNLVPQKDWHAAGMLYSYLGREICHPTNPHCSGCQIISVCRYGKEHLDHHVEK